MSADPLRVLFVCAGNSARSVMAEALLNAMGRGRFVACSAGSDPAGSLDPLAVELLQRNRLPTDGLCSKSWSEFAREGSPGMDFIINLDPGVEPQSCPAIPGQPLRVSWETADPAIAGANEDDLKHAYFRVFSELQRRVSLLVALPLDKLDRDTLHRRLKDMGRREEG